MKTALTLVAAAVGGLSASAWGAIAGPYTPDASTLQLWHMDDGAGATSAANAVGGGLTMQGVLNGATLGNPAHSAPFGTSLDVSAGANNIVSSGNPPAVAPHRAILLGAPALSTSNGGADSNIDDVTLTYADAVTGAYTFEMLVKFNSNYDPLQPYRGTGATAAPGTNNGSYPMEFMNGEGDVAAAGRPFQFRYDQIGFTANGNNTTPKIEFNNIAAGGGGAKFANVPVTGPNAVNNTDWFHVAVTYDGNQAGTNNFKIYWTKVDPSVTEANLIGTFTMSADLVAVAHDFAIGNEARNNGTGLGEGENFYGSIDEVRISGVARAANEMQFIPEPASLSLACLASLVVSRRRRD